MMFPSRHCSSRDRASLHGAVFLGMAVALAAWGTAAAERPNIVLVVTDDQGYWDTGVSGNPWIETPHMDRLAAQGAVIRRCYAAPVCSLTRAGLMTGRCYLRTGLYNTRFGGDTLGLAERTLPELLAAAGYRTALFGKWHLGRYAGYRPTERGFQRFLGHYAGHIEQYSHSAQLVYNERPVQTRGYITDVLTDAAIEFVRAADERPYFCTLAYNAPHSPFLLDTSAAAQPRGDAMIEKYLAKNINLRDARIYAMVERIDQNLGRLLAAVDGSGAADNTLIIFMSDNGGVSRSFTCGLRGSKGTVYEGGLRVPCFVRLPAVIPRGQAIDVPVSHLDVFSTICAAAGAPLPSDRPIDGRSWLPLLTSDAPPTLHERMFHAWNRLAPTAAHGWSAFDGRFKVVCPTPAAGESARVAAELYDLDADPGESRNLAGDERHAALVASLAREFHAWFRDASAGQRFRPIDIPVGETTQPAVELAPSWAKRSGERLEALFDGYEWDTIAGWTCADDSATWRLDIRRAGAYNIRATCVNRSSSESLPIRIDVGSQSLSAKAPCAAASSVLQVVDVGRCILPKGAATLRVQVADADAAGAFELGRVWIEGPLEAPAVR